MISHPVAFFIPRVFEVINEGNGFMVIESLSLGYILVLVSFVLSAYVVYEIVRSKNKVSW
jgi:hypothetical protein